MQLTILGGGGFRVPMVYRALLADPRSKVTSVVLYDVNPARIQAITHVLQQMSQDQPHPPTLRSTSHLPDALRNAAFVFSAIRVGGLEGRVADEEVPLQLGVLGQETTGPGGIAYGLRTVPIALRIAQAITTYCPDAWVINFTNPAGMITEAMQQLLGPRVIGICDSPAALVRRAAAGLGLDVHRVEARYVGLNHLGWLRGLTNNGVDVLPDLLADDAALAATEEGALFGVDWIRTLGAIPNEYLYYYYFTRQAVAASRGAPLTRGQFLHSQQAAFYSAVEQRPHAALAEWQRVRKERSASYMAENRPKTGAPQRAGDDLDAGYEQVALDLMNALANDQPTVLILNVRNGSTVVGLPPDAVVEVTCAVDAAGPKPRPAAPLPLHMLGLVQQVKAVDQLTIRAAVTGSYPDAHAALALHPLVDSVATADLLLKGYLARIPALAASLAHH